MVHRISAGLAFAVMLFAFTAAAVGADEFTEKSMSDPKGSIGYQLQLLKAGDVDKLKACFTERQREKITKEIVEKAKKETEKFTLDELVDKIEKGEEGKMKTAKIKMKNGRSLTTLIEVDGKWLADTIWFK